MEKNFIVREPQGREINIVVNGKDLTRELGMFFFYDKNGKVDIKNPGAVDVVCNYYPDGGGDNPDFPVVFFKGPYDEKLAAKWVGAEHIWCVDTNTQLIKAIKKHFGYPYPTEIERKFVVERPDIDFLLNLPCCNFVCIEQCYVQSPEGNYRVRKRGKFGNYVYTKTRKKMLMHNSMTREEIEERITQEEYEETIKGRLVLRKKRFLILYKGHYFELDIYPFWHAKAVLEIELQSVDEEFEIPPFLTVKREATRNTKYKNSYICARHGVIAE